MNIVTCDVINAPAAFTWKTQKDLELRLSSEVGGVIQVRSAEDSENTFLWANLPPGQMTVFRVSVPATENNMVVRLRNEQVNLDISDRVIVTHEF